MSETPATGSAVHAVRPAGHTPPIGRYSPAVSVPVGGGRLVFVSGQVSADGEGRTIGPGDAATQAETVFHRISEVLKAAGGTLADLVSLVIYLVDLDDFTAVSTVRNRVLADPAPSSTLVEVSSLAIRDHLVEISGVAFVPDGR
ncbi:MULTISPECIES: RidA family protein [Streptomyces]|uniref:Enamine deaminase RidA (YjgF/YER057c/UK114 family) n=2 Tax=Streptomyces TaxID=1883 RepID=A0ABT9KU59_9ACTN|nr:MULTISPECIES: RidA family protein [Streptomyces]MBW8089236.1 RidA family protein [Streptomyces hygroscopicus subsp. hygroscopicus]MCO8304678.1 RidA family protein [Streptomyces sp. RKCA744]MDP9611950.1 enamine deaminase RidA (YjgF/YER057c/UK114 family) [Streptomyces demainii]GHJ26091.1 enamine deaminase RidA [Streptomyces hygroscopicus]